MQLQGASAPNLFCSLTVTPNIQPVTEDTETKFTEELWKVLQDAGTTWKTKGGHGIFCFNFWLFFCLLHFGIVLSWLIWRLQFIFSAYNLFTVLHMSIKYNTPWICFENRNHTLSVLSVLEDKVDYNPKRPKSLMIRIINFLCIKRRIKSICSLNLLHIIKF